MASFKHLGLSNRVLKVITELGFEKPSEIQEAAIPQLLNEDRDFIGLAQTGTGKTAAFGLPLLERIDPDDPNTQALILAPTRELGQQIAEQLNIFSKYMKQVNVLAVYGGAPIVPQMKTLRRAPQHVVIATPGRLLDLLRRKAIKLDMLQFLVLDEADEMLNMGFQEDIDQILSHTPDWKLTWLFSATMPPEMQRIVKQYMDEPFEVKLNTKNEVNKNIDHQFALVKHSNKAAALTRFLDANPGMKGVVFCRTRRDTQELAESLRKQNYKADALHGDLSQQQRDRVMRRFKSGEFQVLIATDVAARGIDVNDLSHVFHLALPDDLAYYTHRSGRTARAGKKGTSIAFVTNREKGRIERLTKKLAIEFDQVMVPSVEDILEQRVSDWCQKILNKRTKGKLDDDLQEKANLLFHNLSKEELISKILMYELESMNIGNNEDLNEKPGRPNNRKKKQAGYNRYNRQHHGGGGSKNFKKKKKFKKKRY